MIFQHATVITMNTRREIINDGAVVIVDDKIVAVDKSKVLLDLYPGEKQVNCNGNILMPGLVDTHVHTAQAILRGCAEDLDLFDWLTKRVWLFQGSITPEDGAASAALCILEMIKSGTTSFLECHLAEVYGFDGVAEVILRSGIRAAIAKIVMDKPAYAQSNFVMPPGLIEDGEVSLQNTLLAHSKWNGAGQGRIQVWFGPRTPGGVTPELYDEIGRLAIERNMGITIHLADIPADIDYARTQGCRSPIDFAYQHGLLGRKSVLAHCVLTDEEDWKVIAATGSHVSHNPVSNAKAATGIAPVTQMLKAGINVALGCDGAPANNTYDLLRDLRMTACLGKLREDDPKALSAETVLEMATINGARAMGISDQTGSIEVGKQADFILVNLDAPHLTPSRDPVSTIVYAAHGSDVDTVIIQGNLIMQGRKVLTLDEDAILADIRQRYVRLEKRAGISITPRWPVL